MAPLLSSTNFMLILLLLVSVNPLHAAGVAPPPAVHAPPGPSAAYALVVFQWPMALCKTSPGCQGDIPTEFRLHGVWPTDGNGNSMMDCTTDPYSHSALKGIEKYLHIYWRSFIGFGNNKDFWKHEWKTHGTCSYQSVLDYFTNSLNLFNKNYKAIFNALGKAGLNPSINTDMNQKGVPRVRDYYDAIDKYLNMIPIIKCKKTTDQKTYMLEIYLCATADLKNFRNCSVARNYRGCGSPNVDKALFYTSPKMGARHC